MDPLTPIAPPAADALMERFQRTIARHRMLETGDNVLVGVSGGPDSVALLTLLTRVRAGRRLRLAVAHLNHRLRGLRSDEEAASVRRLAEAMGLSFFGATRDVHRLRRQRRISLEEAGRMARYTLFHRLAATHGFDKLALGHTADDNAELVLMNLFRGSGPAGLAGIPPVRDGWIIRPLIEARRSEVITFLTRNNLQYADDASNRDTRFLRNRIRHDLMPVLRSAYNPGIAGALNRLAAILRSEADWIDGLVRQQMKTTAHSVHKSRIVLSVSALADLHPALQRRLLRQAIHHVQGGLRRISFRHIDAVIRQSAGAAQHDTILHLPGGLRTARKGDRLSIFRGNAPGKPPGKAHVDARETGPGHPIPRPQRRTQTLDVDSLGIRLRLSEIPPPDRITLLTAGQRTAFFDMEKLVFPLCVRCGRSGDRFAPLGAKGTQTLKKFFTDHKIAREKRRRTPVIVSRGTIIWLVGQRIAEPLKVTPDTRRVLKIELLLA